MNMKIQRAAKNGSSRGVRLDGAGLVRAAYCERVVKEHLGEKASFNTIVRRALVLYQAHCEALVRGDIGNPEDADVYRQFEAMQLRRENEGSQSILTVDAVRDAPTLRTIGELEKEARPLLLNDQIKQQVSRWEQKEHV